MPGLLALARWMAECCWSAGMVALVGLVMDVVDLVRVAAWPVHACHSAIGSGLEGHTGPLTGRWRIAGSATWHWGYDGHTAGAG